MRAILFVGFLLLCSCQPKINSRGNVTLAEKIGTFVVGKTKSNEVMEACGSPSLRKDELTWIYIGARSEEISFREVKLRDKIVVRMIFDNDGILRSLENVTQNNDNKKIITDADKTDLITEKQAALISSHVR